MPNLDQSQSFHANIENLLLYHINTPFDYVFLQLLFKEKENMYCDFRLYSPILAPPMIPRPSMIDSTHLFETFSIALDKNLNEYLRKKIQQKARTVEKELLSRKQAKKTETIIIELQSDEEVCQNILNNQMDIQQNISRNSQNSNLLLDNIHKQSVLGTKQIQGPSQTPSELSKELQQKQSLEVQGKLLQLKQSYILPQNQQFLLPTVECPKLGISNAQLLKKKEKLLRRKVTDWSQVDIKGHKQRRQIRMLKN